MFFRTESPLDNQNKWLHESERYIKCDLCGKVLKTKNHTAKHIIYNDMARQIDLNAKIVETF